MKIKEAEGCRNCLHWRRRLLFFILVLDGVSFETTKVIILKESPFQAIVHSCARTLLCGRVIRKVQWLDQMLRLNLE